MDAGFRARLAALRRQLRRAQLRGAPSGRAGAALAAAEYAAATMELWQEGGPRGAAGWRRPFVESLAVKRLPAMASPIPDEEGWRQAERFVSALTEGRDPLDGETGELRLARRTSAGGLVPHRLFGPAQAATRLRPMVVLLHSFLADEGSWGGVLSGGHFAGLADRYGVLAFCPYNPLAFADPQEARGGELDSAIAAVAEAFGADPQRNYVGGHGAAAEALLFALGRQPRFAARVLTPAFVGRRRRRGEKRFVESRGP